jgi:hypothetical protein
MVDSGASNAQISDVMTKYGYTPEQANQFINDYAGSGQASLPGAGSYNLANPAAKSNITGLGNISNTQLGIAAGAGGIGALLGAKPNYLKPYTPPSAASYGLGATLAPNYTPLRVPNYAAGGSVVPTAGVAPSDLQQNTQSNQGITMADLQNMAGQYGYQLPTSRMADGGIAGLSANPNFPMADQQASRYAVPSQMPVGAQQIRAGAMPPTPMAAGGSTHSDLGSYSDGGRMLKGPGDGMSDNIPASIGGKQPARLADGEFVVPADVVSHLGNGSTDAGAKQLYSMMDKVRKARTGNPKQGKQINPKKYIPK